MNTIISDKIFWVSEEADGVLDISNLVEKYFKKENMKLRNVVDGLQAMLIQGKITSEIAESVKHAIRTRTSYDHYLYGDFESFIKDGDLSRRDMVDSITLAIHYFKNEEHTKLLRYLYKTILK